MSTVPSAIDEKWRELRRPRGFTELVDVVGLFESSMKVNRYRLNSRFDKYNISLCIADYACFDQIYLCGHVVKFYF